MRSAIFRDCDSRVNAREAAAVDAWVKSGKSMHVMRDHPHHRCFDRLPHALSVMGGMWGIVGEAVDVPALVRAHWPLEPKHGVNSRFVSEHVWPLFRDDVLVHGLDGGAWINVGCAVVLPEVFLKAVSVAINLGAKLDGMTTANFDMLRQYRAETNVVQRPPGRGISILGQHELMLPLLRMAVVAKLDDLGWKPARTPVRLERRV